jgi:hypothetical protein
MINEIEENCTSRFFSGKRQCKRCRFFTDAGSFEEVKGFA